MKLNPEDDEDIRIVYDYVDDFLFTGSLPARVYADILAFRSTCKTTLPKRNADDILGLRITRLRKQRLIMITMEKAIHKLMDMLVSKCNITPKAKNTPMLPSQFIIHEHQFAQLPPEQAKFIEDPLTCNLYLSMLGSLNWIDGVRFEILLPVLYLAWNAKAPRQHHLQVALHCSNYLYRTDYLPLVLGGPDSPKLVSYCDASLGSAPNGRSICGSFTKLHPLAGAVTAFSTTTPATYTDIFQGELEAIHKTTKSVKTIKNILHQLLIYPSEVPLIHADNQAANDFSHGLAEAKTSRHMYLRIWLIRDEILMQNVNVVHIDGKENPSDKLTKVPDTLAIFPFCQNILGLTLLNATSHLNRQFYLKLTPDTPDDPKEYPFEVFSVPATTSPEIPDPR